ncbi:hypothetical protein BDV26DRAFT_294261 [Aspergillus bertholletiae]|uniref:Uncharacterized protein n=1 Tax=Aspergillus bertholletiae TaxID=1226010 RepID=A0A5N7B4Z0_9EURO|nr:hypothetical protein BDV26DRAFT_294261 [Aspergillus bertholletiae]
MDQQIAPYIKFPPNDGQYVTKLPLSPDSIPNPTVAFEPAQDDDPRPLVFAWSPIREGYRKDGFVLLRHTSDGKPERVPVPNANETPPEIVNIKVQEAAAPGETYELVWPGMKTRLWDWGVLSDHVGSQLEANPAQPDLIITGGTHVIFTYEQIESPGAPVLSVEFSGPDSIVPGGDHSASWHVHYHGSPTDRPITFRNHVFWEEIRRYHLEDDLWEPEEGGCLRAFLNDPNITVNVTEEEGFTTLKPGNVVVTHGEFGILFMAGKMGMHGVIGLKVVPSFLEGRVNEPADNGGRPQLVVPASNAIEFRTVKKQNESCRITGN